MSEFLERLARPRYRRWSLAAVARSCDLTLGEFVQFWRDAQVERARALACRAAPDIVSEMIEDALAKQVVCERCDGLGWVELAAWAPPEQVPGYRGLLPDGRHIRDCPKCHGSGAIRKPGNPHAIDRVLEIAGLTGKRASAQAVTYNVKSAV